MINLFSKHAFSFCLFIKAISINLINLYSKAISELLFNVTADCYERQSVIATSNLEFGQWTSVFCDNKLIAALVDRLVYHAA